MHTRHLIEGSDEIKSCLVDLFYNFKQQNCNKKWRVGPQSCTSARKGGAGAALQSGIQCMVRQSSQEILKVANLYFQLALQRV